jgi:hypothetical protein
MKSMNVSRLRTGYRKIAGEYNNTYNDVYSNDSPNDDLESRF